MLIPIKTNTSEYNIVLEKGALLKASEYFNLSRKVLVVTDSGVPQTYSQEVANQCKTPFIVTVNQGEGSKSIEVFNDLLKKMVEFGFTRSDCVVAVGGGVVGDLAGFVASSYMRGVDFYNIPTTVLSQLDSSIGGKTAINFCGIKNIVGAFYQPKGVLIDTETLKTLPERQISNGLAEGVKMSLTNDEELFSVFENEDIYENLEKIIEKSLKIKAFVVEQDEKETGLRKILNFGHTLAHAIESESQMKELYHGECVALGMLVMCSEGVKTRLIKVLNKLNLPTSINFNVENLITVMKHDKKMSGENITVIFVNEIGKYEMKNLDFSDFASIVREGLK